MITQYYLTFLFIKKYNIQYSSFVFQHRLSPKPSLPPRIGINGFDRIGRLIFRSAVEAGYDIAAGSINNFSSNFLLPIFGSYYHAI